MFSVVESIIRRPLPYVDPDRLVVVWPGHFLGNREVAFLRENARTLDAVGSYSPGWLMGLTGVAEPTQISAGRISGNLFPLLGVRPALGRTFGIEAETPGEDRVVVLSDALWRRSFGADPAIVGRSIELDLRVLHRARCHAGRLSDPGGRQRRVDSSYHGSEPRTGPGSSPSS